MRIYEQMGRKAQARKDLERIYAENPRFLDVAERLGLASPYEVPARPDA